jgi:toxin YoeB
LVTWRLVWSKQAEKDFKKIIRAGLEQQVHRILDILKKNPYQNPPPFEKLVGDFSGAYSRRINIHHRIVYQIADDKKTVKIFLMWTHYK